MSENTLTCQIHKKNQNYNGLIKCKNPPLPGDALGCCILHSDDKEKDPDAFRGAIRAIWDQKNQEEYDFCGVFFPGQFDPEDFFGSREFKKSVNFSYATFTGKADFSEVNFKAGAKFSWATFKAGAYFSGATFTAGAYFSGAIFTEETFFIEATFREETYFVRATFIEGATFFGARIEGRLNFLSTNSLWEAQSPRAFSSIFRHLEFIPGAMLRFHDLSLALAQFTGTDLRQVEFRHVRWHSYWGRQTVYDEIVLNQNEKKNPCLLRYSTYVDPPTRWTDWYGEVEQLYRDLQKNYEKAGDYKRMGDFHYGEMEMHRRASKWRWFPFYWNNLYWALSGYGERPSRALVWLAAFLMIFTCFLAWAGLEIIDLKHSANFGNSFFYLLQKVTLQRPTWAEPQGFWGKLVAGLSVLLIPGQAALFLLALRNRLGRRR